VTGNFHIVGAAGNMIILNNTSGIAAGACGPNPDINHWVLHILGIATIDYVDVSNSWAPPSATVTRGPNTFNGGNNCNWLFVIPIIASWTLDTDGNGRIDRIRVQVDVGTQLSENFDPVKLRAVAQGYSLKSGVPFGTAGGNNDDVFDILLKESPYLDTDVRPQWQLLANDQPYTVNPGIYARTNLDGNLNPVNKPMLATLHRVSDVGLGLIEPVFATDLLTQRDPLRGGIGRITSFDGSGFLQDLDTQLQGRILAATATNWTTTITWDVNVSDPILLVRLWIPTGVTTLFPPAGRDSFHNADTAARSDLGDQFLGLGSPLRNFDIPSSDPEILDGAGNKLPCARIANPSDPSTARPWSYKVRDLRTQRGSVTILHNVIDPTRGEKAGLHYSLGQSGYVTILVFDLKGDVVQELFRDQRDKGEHATTWDGCNHVGRVVARGIYFIKFVGPGINEIRNVLVVK
jgi:hypothetical protein